MSEAFNPSGASVWPDDHPFLAKTSSLKDEYVYLGTCDLKRTDWYGSFWSPKECSRAITAAVYANHFTRKAYVAFDGAQVTIDYNAITISKKVVLL